MRLTERQSEAVTARGNVIVVAGAGTGKTSTLVARCLDVVRQGSSLEKVLMVTFTDAAAAEMRHRLRVELQRMAEESAIADERERFAEQLALIETARISTIHSFCLRLVQTHFHELGLDPEVKLLDEQQSRLLTQETLDALMEDCYSGTLPISEHVRSLIATYAPGSDSTVRELVLKLYRHAQSLRNAEGWIQEQQAACAADFPEHWDGWLIEAFKEWRRQWLPAIKAQAGVKNIDDCLAALNGVPDKATLVSVREASAAIHDADCADWNKLKKKVREPLKRFFEEAEFLHVVADSDSLAEDWQAVREHMGALLQLSAEFTTRFTRAKRELGAADFSDLEQLTLQLLLDEHGQPSAVAEEIRDQTDYVFVDECQDINGVQDAILSAVSRDGSKSNRFLVGDVKQSIYQFRLADPRIFRGYEVEWSRDASGQRISLAENFRSRPGILKFVNTLFGSLMRESFGGVPYEPLTAGAGRSVEEPADSPSVELHFIRKASNSNEAASGDDSAAEIDLSAAEREARLVALRLRELKESEFKVCDKDTGDERAIEWGDMAVLLRSPGPRTEAFAKAFHQAGIPLAAARAGFLDAVEVSDLVSLLHLLDNPLQDIPLLAVLRSPLVGLSLDDLATIRAGCDSKPFWRALKDFDAQDEGGDASVGLRNRVHSFLEQYAHWREQVRQVGPSLCLEQVLIDTRYDTLLGANERGSAELANVRRLLDLARQFDPYLRQGLYRFLQFLNAMQDAGDSLEPAPVPTRDAVQLMSIHRSKGLEFPVVVMAGWGTRFNLRDLSSTVLLDQKYGVAAKAMTPSGMGRYPTLPFWLAERRQRAQQLGEELRLLYVAATRARDRLICTGTLPKKDQGRWESLLAPERAAGEDANAPGQAGEGVGVSGQRPVTDLELLSANNPLTWLLAWLPTVTRESDWEDDNGGKSDLMTWQLWDPADPKLSLTPTPLTVDQEGGSDEPPDVAEVERVRERLSWEYPHGAASAEPAKSSVSALRTRAVELADEDAVNRFTRLPNATGNNTESARGMVSAAERGTLHHRFLQHLRIEAGTSEVALKEQALVLAARGVFTKGELEVLDLGAIATFWNTEVGRQIQAHSAGLQRELAFTARFDDAEVRSVLGQAPDDALAGEFVVVQGVVDLAVLLPGEIWLLDFKTDAVRGAGANARAEQYRPQLDLYAKALERIYRRPVTRRWLHFLSSGETL